MSNFQWFKPSSWITITRHANEFELKMPEATFYLTTKDWDLNKIDLIEVNRRIDDVEMLDIYKILKKNKLQSKFFNI